MLVTKTLLVSTLALLANAANPTVTSVTPAQQTKVVNDLVSYFSSLAGQPAFTTEISVLQTALPSDATADPSDFFNELATATTTPARFTALPSSQQQYWSSIGNAESSIINKDVKGAAPTAAPALKMAGLVGAVGGAIVLGAM